MMKLPSELPIIEQKETIKLIKNTKGYYNWEVKIHIVEDEKSVERLEKLNEEMIAKFGSEKDA